MRQTNDIKEPQESSFTKLESKSSPSQVPKSDTKAKSGRPAVVAVALLCFIVASARFNVVTGDKQQIQIAQLIGLAGKSKPLELSFLESKPGGFDLPAALALSHSSLHESPLSRLNDLAELHSRSHSDLKTHESQLRGLRAQFMPPSGLMGVDSRQPPVYQSQPKQVDTLKEINALEVRKAHSRDALIAAKQAPVDLRAAGAYHSGSMGKKQKSKILEVEVVKPKKKKKKRKKKKTKVKKIHVIVETSKSVKPTTKKGLEKHPTNMGKFYEYREVPHKGAWKFGFKRGNDKHKIERKEWGQKSKFKSEFKWSDKMGKGKLIFDYNHVS